MPLSDYQKQVDDIMSLDGRGYWQPLAQLGHLIEEVGELARLLNHLYGDKPKKNTEAKQDMAGELGDIIFATICLANSEGIDLDKAVKGVLHKTVTRDKDRFRSK